VLGLAGLSDIELHRRQGKQTLSSMSRPEHSPLIKSNLATVVALALLAYIGLVTNPLSADPSPVARNAEIQRAFDRYVQLTEARIANDLRPGGPFLSLDALPAVDRAAAYAAVRAGQLRMDRLETLDNGRSIPHPGSMIHHWVGIAFIPSTTLEKTLHLMQNYDHDAEIYAPDVTRAKIISHSGDDFRVYMRIYQKRIITVVLDTDHEIHYQRLDKSHAISRSISTRVQQIENPGTPQERALADGQDDGFLWRINSYWRFLERDGGTYVQSESVSLTRDIPTGLGWLIGPFVESIPRELLRNALESTRRGLTRAAFTPSLGPGGDRAQLPVLRRRELSSDICPV
jgi:hypothetical protein